MACSENGNKFLLKRFSFIFDSINDCIAGKKTLPLFFSLLLLASQIENLIKTVL